MVSSSRASRSHGTSGSPLFNIVTNNWILTVTQSFRPSSSDQKDRIKKSRPNLREAPKDNTKAYIVAACVLVAIYMYPMILRPLLTDDLENRRDSTEVDVSKYRPSFMPEWTSPFGPRSKDK